MSQSMSGDDDIQGSSDDGLSFGADDEPKKKKLIEKEKVVKSNEKEIVLRDLMDDEANDCPFQPPEYY